MKRIIRKIFNSRPSQEGGIFFTKISDIIGYKPQNISHFTEAFTHRSINAKDDKGNTISYERLEFLGDAMLSAIIAEYLFNKVPHGNEGYLTKMRSKVVSREHLNELGKDLNLINLIESKIAASQFGENIHGNLFEAIIGAIYLDKNLIVAEKVILDLWKNHIKGSVVTQIDAKTTLQELTLKNCDLIFTILFSLFNHLRVASRLPPSCDYMLFRSSILPCWEDPQNSTGGRWVLYFSKSEQVYLNLDVSWLASVNYSYEMIFTFVL